MARHSYKADFRAVYDLQGNIVDYAPSLIPGERCFEIRAELLGQAQSHLESLSAKERGITDLTLKLTFNRTEQDKELLARLVKFICRRFCLRYKS